jgi:hypothetical protein
MTDLLGAVLQTGGVLACAAVFLLVPGMLLVRPLLPGRSALALRAVTGYVCGYAGFTVLADLFTRLAGTSLFTLLVGPGMTTALLGLLLRRATNGNTVTPASSGLRLSWLQLACCAAFACLVILQVAPVSLGEQVYWGYPYTDYTKHVSFTRVVARTGSPPLNPTYAPFGDQYLFYYFGLYLFPGALVRYAGFDAVVAVSTCAVLTAACFASVCVTLGNLLAGSWRGGWLALALCWVTGLDILPVAWLEAHGVSVPDLEWWNPGQVTAITGFLAWVPQHATAALEALTAHLLLDGLGTSPGPAAWRDVRIAPAVLLTAACGMTSTYVAELLFASLAVHALLPFWRGGAAGRQTSASWTALTAGAVLVLPFYLHLMSIDRYQGASQEPAFRPFAWEDSGSRLGFFRWFDRFRPVLGARQAYRLFTLPLQYALEFGFWAIVGVWWIVAGLRRPEVASLTTRLAVLCGCGLLIGSVFVSVRQNPDLNWRVLHAPQGVLVAVGAAFLLRPRGTGWRNALLGSAVVATLYLGVAGSLYNYYNLRVSFAGTANPGPGVIGRARAASLRIEAVTPVTARIQYNPTYNPAWLTYLNRQAPLSDSGFNSICFGVSKAEHAVVLREISSIFDAGLSAGEREVFVSRYKIDYLLIQREDPIFETALQDLLPHAPTVVCGGADWVLLDTSASVELWFRE